MDVVLILLGAWLAMALVFVAVVRGLGFVADRADLRADEEARERWGELGEARPRGRRRVRARGAPPDATAPAGDGPVPAQCGDCGLPLMLAPRQALLCPQCRGLIVPAADAPERRVA